LEAEPEQWTVHWICGQFGRWKLQKVKRGDKHFLVFWFFHGAESSASEGLYTFLTFGHCTGRGRGRSSEENAVWLSGHAAVPLGGAHRPHVALDVAKHAP
jgi:hypothetical protein